MQVKKKRSLLEFSFRLRLRYGGSNFQCDYVVRLGCVLDLACIFYGAKILLNPDYDCPHVSCSNCPIPPALPFFIFPCPLQFHSRSCCLLPGFSWLFPLLPQASSSAAIVSLELLVLSHRWKGIDFHCGAGGRETEAHLERLLA